MLRSWRPSATRSSSVESPMAPPVGLSPASATTTGGRPSRARSSASAMPGRRPPTNHRRSPQSTSAMAAADEVARSASPSVVTMTPHPSSGTSRQGCDGRTAAARTPSRVSDSVASSMSRANRGSVLSWRSAGPTIARRADRTSGRMPPSSARTSSSAACVPVRTRSVCGTVRYAVAMSQPASIAGVQPAWQSRLTATGTPGRSRSRRARRSSPSGSSTPWARDAPWRAR